MLGIDQRYVPVSFETDVETDGLSQRYNLDDHRHQNSTDRKTSSLSQSSFSTTAASRRSKVVSRLSSCVFRIKTRVVNKNVRPTKLPTSATTTDKTSSAQDAADVDLFWILVKELLAYHDCHTSFVSVQEDQYHNPPSSTYATSPTKKKQVHFQSSSSDKTLDVHDRIRSFIYTSPSLRVDGRTSSSATASAPPSLLHTGRDADLTETPLNNLLLNDWDIICHHDKDSERNKNVEDEGATILTSATPVPSSSSSISKRSNMPARQAAGCCPLCLASGLGDSEVSSICMSVFSTLLLLLDGPTFIASKLAMIQSRLEAVVNATKTDEIFRNSSKSGNNAGGGLWSQVHAWRLYDGIADTQYHKYLAQATSLNAPDLRSIDERLDIYEHVQRCVEVHTKAALRSAVWNGQLHTTADNILLFLDNHLKKREVAEVLAAGQTHSLLERNGVYQRDVDDAGGLPTTLPSRIRLTTPNGGYYYQEHTKDCEVPTTNYTSNSIATKALEYCEKVFTDTVANSAAACTSLLKEQVTLLLYSEIQAHEALQYTNGAVDAEDVVSGVSDKNVKNNSASFSEVDQYIEAATLSERAEEQTLTSLQVLHEGAVMALEAVSVRAEAATFELLTSISKRYASKAIHHSEYTDSSTRLFQHSVEVFSAHLFIFTSMITASPLAIPSLVVWDTNRLPIRVAISRLKDQLQLPGDGKVSMVNLLEGIVAMGITFAATMNPITASSSTSHDGQVGEGGGGVSSEGYQYTPFFSSSLTLLHFLVLKGYKASLQVLLQWCSLPSITASAISSINSSLTSNGDGSGDDDQVRIPAVATAVKSLILSYVGLSDRMLNQEDGAGRTPIGIALCAENTEATILLISAGCIDPSSSPSDDESDVRLTVQSPYVSLHKPFRCRDGSITSPSASTNQLITPLEYMLNQIQKGQATLIKREMMLRDQRTQERCYGGSGGVSDEDEDEDNHEWEGRMDDELSPLASIQLTLYCSVAAHFLRYPPVVVLHGALPTYMLRYVQGFNFEQEESPRWQDKNEGDVQRNHADLRLMLPNMKFHPSVKACETATEIFDHLEVETITIAAARKPKTNIIELASMYGNRHPEAHTFLTTAPKKEKDSHSLSISMKIAASDPYWRFVVIAPMNGISSCVSSAKKKDPFLCGVVGNVISARQFNSPIRLGIGLKILVRVATDAIIALLRRRGSVGGSTFDTRRADLLKESKDVTRSRVLDSYLSSSSVFHSATKIKEHDSESELIFPLGVVSKTNLPQQKESTLIQTAWSSIAHSVMPSSSFQLENTIGDNELSVEELLFNQLIDVALAEAVDVAISNSADWVVPEEANEGETQLSHVSSGGFPSQDGISYKGVSGTHPSSLNHSGIIRTPSGASLTGMARPILPRGRGVTGRGRGTSLGAGRGIQATKNINTHSLINDDDETSSSDEGLKKATPSKRVSSNSARVIKQPVKTISKKVSVAPRRGAPPLPTSRTTNLAANKRSNHHHPSTAASFRVDLSSDDDEAEIVVSPIRRVNPTPKRASLTAESPAPRQDQQSSILLQQAPPAGVFNNVDEPCPPVAISAKTGDVLLWVQDVAELVVVPRPPTWCLRLLSELLQLSTSNNTNTSQVTVDVDSHTHRCEVLQLFFHPHFMGVVESAFQGGNSDSNLDFSNGNGDEKLIHLSPFSRRRQLHNHVVDDVLGDLLSDGDNEQHETSAIIMGVFSSPKTSEEARFRQQRHHDALLQQARMRGDASSSSLGNITSDLLRKIRPGGASDIGDGMGVDHQTTPQRSALNQLSPNNDNTIANSISASPIYTNRVAAFDQHNNVDAFVVVTDVEIEETITTSTIHHPLEPDTYSFDAPLPENQVHHNNESVTITSRVHRHESCVDPSDQVTLLTSVLTSAREQYLRSLYFGVVCDPDVVCSFDSKSCQQTDGTTKAHPLHSDPQELLRGMKADLLSKSHPRKNRSHGDVAPGDGSEGDLCSSTSEHHRRVSYDASCTMARSLFEGGLSSTPLYRAPASHQNPLSEMNQFAGVNTLAHVRCGVVNASGSKQDWREQLRARRHQESEHVLQPGTLLYFKTRTTVTDGDTVDISHPDAGTTRPSLLLYEQLFMRATGENVTSTVCGDAVNGVGGNTTRTLPGSSSTKQYGYTTFEAIEFVPTRDVNLNTAPMHPLSRYDRQSTLLSVLTLKDEIEAGYDGGKERSTIHLPSNTETLSHMHCVLENTSTSGHHRTRQAHRTRPPVVEVTTGCQMMDVVDDVILDCLVKGGGLNGAAFNLCCSAFGVESHM